MGTVDSSISSASGSASPPRTTTGAGPASSGASSSSYCRRTPRMRTTTRSVPAASAATPASSRRAGLPSRQSAPLARAERRSVSLVDSSVKTDGTLPGRAGTSRPGPGQQRREQLLVLPPHTEDADDDEVRAGGERGDARVVQAGGVAQPPVGAAGAGGEEVGVAGRQQREHRRHATGTSRDLAARTRPPPAGGDAPGTRGHAPEDPGRPGSRP